MTSSKRNSKLPTVAAAALMFSLPGFVFAAGPEGAHGPGWDPACFLVPADSLHAVDAGEHVEVTICQRPLFDDQFPVIHRDGSLQHSFEYEASAGLKSSVRQGSVVDQTIALIE